MDRLRYQLLAKHNAALASGEPTSFDTTRPWNAVWSAAVTDTEYWQEEFHRHAILIATNVISPLAPIGNDAPVVGTGQPATSSQPKTTAAQPKAAAKGLCRNFNNGSCHGDSCPKGYGKHACSICGSPRHGAVTCPKVAAKQGNNDNNNADKNGKNKRRWGNDKKGKKHKGQ